MSILKLLINVMPALLRIGTLLGKDKHFERRDQEELHGYVVVGISALDRSQLMQVFNHVAEIEDSQERYFQLMSLQAQAIAKSLRNKRGYFVFDPLNIKHLHKISSYPDNVLEDWLEKVAALSDMPWFDVKKQKRDAEAAADQTPGSAEAEPVNPS